MKQLTEDMIRNLIQGAVQMERARIGHMLTKYAMSIVEDKTSNARDMGVSAEEEETVKLVVGTFVAVFVQRLAEEPLPEVCVHCIDGTPHDEKVH